MYFREIRGQGHVASSCRSGNETSSYIKCGEFIDFLRNYSRSQWPRGLRRRSAAARLLRSWVRIPPGAWIFVCCECRVLSGRGLYDQLITRPEESYRLSCVVVCDLETSRIGAIYIYNISCLRVNRSAHCSGRKQVKG